MKMNIGLSREQALAVRAVAETARMSEDETFKACAFATVNSEYDDVDGFTSHLKDVAKVVRQGKSTTNGSVRRFPCGVRVPQEIRRGRPNSRILELEEAIEIYRAWNNALVEQLSPRQVDRAYDNYKRELERLGLD